jgi:Mce-associated membrane protein
MISTAAIRAFLGGPLRTAIVVVAMLAVVAFAVTGWFGMSWYRAARDASFDRGMARDAVLQDARQAMVNLNTIDYRRVQDGLTLWEQSAAGSLLGEMRTNRGNYERAIIDSKTATTARILDGAVVVLDEGSGTAQVLVGVDVTSQFDDGAANCVRRRIQLDMRRDGDAWKIDKLAPIGAANPMSGACPGTTPGPSK